MDGAAFATGAIPTAARARPPAIIDPAAVAFTLSMQTPRQNIVVVLGPKAQAQPDGYRWRAPTAKELDISVLSVP
jgi:hypothetical protein